MGRTAIASLILLIVCTGSAADQELPVQRLPGERKLTAADEAELSRQSAPHGKPWLILEPQQGQSAETWHAQVFLQPNEDRSGLRRGTVLQFRARANAGTKELGDWRVSSYRYAQVPTALSGELSRDSVDLPFYEINRLPDDELLGVVAFVRTCPCLPQNGPAPAAGNAVNGRRPIGSVRVGSGGTVVVSVQRDKWSGWELTVRREEGAWRLISIQFFIA